MIKLTKEFKVGLFSFGGVVIFILGFNFLMGYSFFKTYARYYVVYDNAGGLIKSTQVQANGIKIGQVEEVTLLNKSDVSKILVTLVIDGNIKLNKGAIAQIASSDLLGTKVINLQNGNSLENHMPEDTLSGNIEEGLAESINNLVSPVKEKSEQVLATLDRVLQSMNTVFDSNGTQRLSKGVEDLAGTLANVRSITQRIDQLTKEEEDRIQLMFAHTESILKNLKQNNEVISLAMKNIKNITDSLAASELKSTINNLNGSLSSLSIMLNKINNGQGSLGQLANNDSLYNNLNNSSKELTNLLVDIQKYPARYITISVFGGGKRANKAEKKRNAELQKK
ncbi:MAG: MlaD family protein [Bacteroidia bacterium]|nr:MlaD family protein [Bacteroidia bacterium]